MKTDELISQLAQNPKPVRKWPSFAKVLSSFTGMGLFIMLLLFAVEGWRPDLADKFLEMPFRFSFILSFVLMIASLTLIARMATPGAIIVRSVRGSWLLLLGVLAVACVVAAVRGGKEELSDGLAMAGQSCSTMTIVSAALFAAFLLACLRYAAAPVHLLRISLAIAVASFACGFVIISLHCGFDNGMHVLVWHLLVPLILTVSIVGFLGRKILRW